MDMDAFQKQDADRFIAVIDYVPFEDVTTFVGRPSLYRWMDDVFRVGTATAGQKARSRTVLDMCIIREPNPDGELVFHREFGDEDEREKLLVRALNTIDPIQAGYLVGEKIVIPNIKHAESDVLAKIFKDALEQMQEKWNERAAKGVGVGFFYESTILAALHADAREDVHIHRLFRKMLK